VVAFVAGEVSAADGSGWSVTVLGRADVDDVPAPRAADSCRHHGQVCLRIRAELVTGRLLRASRACRP
jgi:hypothetical protein